MAAAEMKTLASPPRSSPVIGREQVWAGRWLMGNDVRRRRQRESKITRPDFTHATFPPTSSWLPWRPLLVCSQGSFLLIKSGAGCSRLTCSHASGQQLTGRTGRSDWEDWEGPVSLRTDFGETLWALGSSGMFLPLNDAETPNQTRGCWGHFLRYENTWMHHQAKQRFYPELFIK